MGRSRGGLTSKIHAVVDTNGLPVRLGLTAGEAHDNRLALSLLSRPEIDRRCRGLIVMTQTGSEPCRNECAPVIVRPGVPSDPICFSPYLYRARNLVERFFNKIKQCRRVATRYDKFPAC